MGDGGRGGHLLDVVLKSITCGLIDLLLCFAKLQFVGARHYLSHMNSIHLA